jgi:methylated-DNA-[protein]-cysteine S-methyltransferase|tara:strand:- start:370 stop:645 length:276 start_codon:yes stop_codon:yes gene_type:complete
MKKLNGTKFQISVWKEIKKIPKGQTKTYKDIAVALKKPKSSRAVANACGKNPLLIEIPCHRVIRSDGKLGGYSGKGGMNQKRKLLKEEGAL